MHTLIFSYRRLEMSVVLATKVGVDRRTAFPLPEFPFRLSVLVLRLTLKVVSSIAIVRRRVATLFESDPTGFFAWERRRHHP